jgi:serine/threonine-protein kinase HipA
MTDSVLVSVEIEGVTHPVGVVHVTETRGSITSVFSYEPSYLSLTGAYAIDPDLPLVSGNQVVRGGLPGALRDASPDRWGRNLIRKKLLAGDSGHTARQIGEVDFLIGVSDETRQGALRFSQTPGGPYLDDTSLVPPLIELGRLRQAALRISLGDDPEGVKELLRAGTASLGGARPKAAVRDADRMLLAKFSHPTDDYDQVGAECVALDLAEIAGIETPWHDLMTIDDDRVLVVERFDRRGGQRVGFMSAMTLAGISDGDTLDYVILEDHVRDHSIQVTNDRLELWRRMLFSVGMWNLDDHGRNHGFLRDGNGWSLAPVFDVTPDPSGSVRATAMAGAVTNDDCLTQLPQIATGWGISPEEQRTIARDVVNALDYWPQQLRVRGVRGPTMTRLSALIAENARRFRETWLGD